MLKSIILTTGLGAGTLAAATIPEGTSSFIQYGALGLLGACVMYVITRLVPQAMDSRRKETEAFLTTLTSEREKIIASMEKLTKSHEDELVAARRETDQMIRHLNQTTGEERKIWAELMTEVKVFMSRNTEILCDVRDHLKDNARK